MTPRLRLAGALVDVPRADHARAVSFWTAALGTKPQTTEKFPDYAQYDEVTPGLYFMVQATGDDAVRVHLDFESADRDADVERLAALGAIEVMRSHHWVVMRDPVGTTFCVVQQPASNPSEKPADSRVVGATSHRSRLCAAYIDVPRESYAHAVSFWRDALGVEPEVDADDPSYSSFGQATPGVDLDVQAVGEPAGRVHLDIETDDIEAEVARLIAIGATAVDRIETWVVMRDPVGTTFCVVRVQIPEMFEASATWWPAT